MILEHRNGRRRPRGVDVLAAAEAVAEKVMLAAYDASRALTELGVTHALIGGIAVGAHGVPRATADVDFLVRESEAFEGEKIISFRQGVPIAVRSVQVDYLTPSGSSYRELLEEALEQATVSAGIPVVSLEALVVMKLEAGRRRDMDDVARLLEHAEEERRVRAFIEARAPGLLGLLDGALG